uniref:Ground-like domain-containing protein n=1 Tax=Steinernema glaseri TaxID=37863 RepID=A0A1I7YKY3_9BILA
MAFSSVFLLALLPLASGFFFPQQGGCGCGAPPPPPCAPPPPPPCPALPPPCPPQLPPIQLPSLPLPCPPPPPCGCAPALPQLPPLQLPRFPAPCGVPAPCGCGRKKRAAPTVRGASGVSGQSLCNNQQIRKIILKNLDADAAVSKAAIHAEVKAKLGGNFVVLCSQGAFSFVADSHNYCVDGSDSQTCYVFQA